MVRNERVSLLISTYNWPEALELSLYSLSKQSVLPDEVIIADDGSTSDTAEAIKRAAKYLPVPVKHIWQEDKGFRKSLILNKGVKAATGDYIIQIDGDIVMDRHFIEDHVSVMKRGYFIRGSRSMLNENTTRKLIYKFKSGQFENARIKGDKNRFNSMRIKLLSKLIKYLKSEGKIISTETLYTYIDALCKALIIQKIYRYDIHGKAILKTLNKYYMTDLGIAQIKNNNFEINKCFAIENVVFNELVARGYEVYIGKLNPGEIDFIASKSNERKYFQVTYLLSDKKVEEREFGALKKIEDNYPKYVISLDKTDFSQNGVIHKNIVDWLLGAD